MTTIEKMAEALESAIVFITIHGGNPSTLRQALTAYEAEKGKYTTVLKKDIETVISGVMDEDGDFTGAVSILCRMIGLVYPAGELKDEDVVLTNISELTGESEFKAPGLTGEEECGERI